jgi:hypothetical protein
LAKHKPTVFISHAEHDKDEVLDMVGAISQIATVVCSSDDEETRAEMNRGPSLEEEQIHKVGQACHYAIVVLSETYCSKVDKGEKVGVVREWEMLKAKNQSSIIYTYIGKHAVSIKGKMADYLGDKPVLRVTDTGGLLSRLMKP